MHVKPPLLARKWVQLVASAIAGAAVVLVAAWVIHGLRKDRAVSRASEQAKTKLVATQSWKSTLEGALAGVGPASQNGAPPAILSDLDTSLTALGKGNVPKGADGQLKADAKKATTAADTINTFDLSSTITGKGFLAIEATQFTDSKASIVEALKLYAKAADVARSAAEASGSLRVDLAKAASGIRDEALNLFQSGWGSYTEALRAGGIQPVSPNGIPGPGP